MILLNFGWMVDLAMSIFEVLTKFLVFWHPLHPWVCIRSDLKPLFETDMSDSSYCELAAIPYSIISHTNPPLLYLQARRKKIRKVGICPDLFLYFWPYLSKDMY